MQDQVLGFHRVGNKKWSNDSGPHDKCKHNMFPDCNTHQALNVTTTRVALNNQANEVIKLFLFCVTVTVVVLCKMQFCVRKKVLQSCQYFKVLKGTERHRLKL